MIDSFGNDNEIVLETNKNDLWGFLWASKRLQDVKEIVTDLILKNQ